MIRSREQLLAATAAIAAKEAQRPRRGRPRTGTRRPKAALRVPPIEAPASLPLPELDLELTASTNSTDKELVAAVVGAEPMPPPPQPLNEDIPAIERAMPRIGANGRPDGRHTKAVKAFLMRRAGIDDADIAAALNISRKTISDYIYRAGKAGVLAELLDDPRDTLEYVLLNKVVRNINESLDSTRVLQTGMPERAATALKVAEHTLFPKTQGPAQQTSNNVMGIKIEIVQGAPTVIREGTVAGAPGYIDGEAEPVE